MAFTYISMLEMETKKIDRLIAQEINTIATDLCKKLKNENINMIETQPLIECIKNKNEFVQNMLKGNFAETEAILKEKLSHTQIKPKDNIDFLSSRLLNKRINVALEKMLQKYTSPLETSTIFDRKIFLDTLFNFNKRQISKEHIENEK